MVHACSTKKRYGNTESKRIHTAARLRLDNDTCNLSIAKPAIATNVNNQKAFFTKNNTNLPRIYCRPISKPAYKLESLSRPSIKKRPDNKKKTNEILDDHSNKRPAWLLEVNILVDLYFVSILAFSLFYGLSGLLYGILIFLPLLLASLIIYLISIRANADYEAEVRVNPSKENRYNDIKIASWSTLAALAALFGIFIILAIFVLLPIEEGVPLMLGLFFAINWFIILVLLVAFIVLAILSTVKQHRHIKASKISPKQKEPYTFWNAPWHRIAILFLAIACFALLSPTAPIISIPFFAGLFTLSLDNTGLFTKYTRLLLALVSVGLCIAYILAFSTYLAPILALTIAICLIFLLKRRRPDTAVKRYKSLIKAIANIAIVLILCILGVIVFLGPDASLPLLSMVSYSLLFSAMMFFLALLVMMVTYLIRPIELDSE